MIKAIRIKDIKDKTLTQKLTGKDIFIGPNGSGKSTIQQAIGFSMLGYAPGEGKKIQETFELSSGDEMSAGLQTDNFSFDRVIKRTSKLNGDGTNDIKYSESLTVSPNKGEKTIAQLEARIASEIGSFPMVFDFALFTELSDAKKRDHMYSLSPITNDSWDKARVSEHLNKTLLTEVLKANTPEVYEATQELIADCMEMWPSDYDLTSGLQAVIAWVDSQQKDWNKKKSDATGAVRELNDMKNQLEETDRDIVAKKRELQKLRNDHTDVHGQITAGREIKRQWDSKQERINDLKTGIEQLIELLSVPDETDYEVQVNAIKEKINQTDIANESDEIQKQINVIRFNKDENQAAINKIDQETNVLQNEIHTYETVLKNIKAKGIGSCVLDNNIACDKDFSGFIHFATDNGAKINAKILILSEERKVLVDAGKALYAQSDELETKKRSLHNTFLEESKKNELLRNQIDDIRKFEQQALQGRQNKVNNQASLQEELNRLVGEKMPAFAPLDLLEPQFEALTNQITEAEGVLEEKEKAKITLSNKQAAILSASKAQYYFTGCKKISEALGAKGIQGELVKSILGPIEAAVNENLQLMGINYPAYFSTESETGKEVFRFGWIKGERQINFNVLSKGEKLMFLSAFLVTLLERANPSLKVLALDEIQNLDKTNFINVLNGLSALSHKLDNIIIAGVVDPMEIEGWTFWDLTPQTTGDSNAEPF
jgi:DNA repair exonuclease SbcCD ATPase subunit